MTKPTVGELGAIAPIADREVRRWALDARSRTGSAASVSTPSFSRTWRSATGLLEGVLDLVDETASSWLHETFRLWLVVNLESLDRDRAADVVAEAFRHRFDTRPGSR